MARDLNGLFRQYKESTVRYKSRLDFICNKYAEQSENEEDWVVDLSCMDFTGSTEELATHLRKLKSSKDNGSRKVPKTNFNNRLAHEEADQWLLGVDGEAENRPKLNQYEVLKDVSTCMEQLYGSQESEPSDAETISSTSSTSEDTLYSDYNSDSSDGESESSDEDTYLTENVESHGSSGAERVVDSRGTENVLKAAQYRDEAYFINGNRNRSPRYNIERRAKYSGEFLKSENSTERWQYQTNGEKGTPNHNDNQRIKQQRNRYRDLDLFENEDFAKMNEKDSNRNICTADKKYIQDQRFVEQPQTEMRKSQRDHRDNYSQEKESQVRDLHNVFKFSRNRHLDNNRQKDSPRSDFMKDYGYNDSLDAMDGSMISAEHSHQSPYTSQPRASERQSQSEGRKHHNKDLGTYDREQEKHVNSKTYTIANEYRSSPNSVRNRAIQNSFDAESSPRFESDAEKKRQTDVLRLSGRKKIHSATDYKHWNADGVNEGSYTAVNKRTNVPSEGKRKENRYYSNEQNALRSPRSSGGDYGNYDSTFDKSSKKDSGISSYMEDTHSSETTCKVLSVKNLKAFNESFSEKWCIDVSMNHSDLAKKSENENVEKVQYWLNTFKGDPCNDREDNSDLQLSVDDSSFERLVRNSTPKKIRHELEKSGRSTPVDKNRSRHTSGHVDTVNSACQTMANSPRYVETDKYSPRQAQRRKLSPRLSIPGQGPQKVADKRVVKKVARSLKGSVEGTPKRKSRDIGEMIRNVYSSPLQYRMIEESLQRSSSLSAGKRLAEALDYDEDTKDDISGTDFVPTPPKSRRTSLGSKIHGDGIDLRQRGSGHGKASDRQLLDTFRDQGHVGKQQLKNEAGAISMYSDEISYMVGRNRFEKLSERDARLSVSDSTISRTNNENFYGHRNEMIPEKRNGHSNESDKYVNEGDVYYATRLKHLASERELSKSNNSHLQGLVREFDGCEYIGSNEYLSDMPVDTTVGYKSTHTQMSPRQSFEAERTRQLNGTNSSNKTDSLNRDSTMYRNHFSPEMKEQRTSQQTYVIHDKHRTSGSFDKQRTSRSFDSVKQGSSADENRHYGRSQDHIEMASSCRNKVKKTVVQNTGVFDQERERHSPSSLHYINNAESLNRIPRNHYVYREDSVANSDNGFEIPQVINRSNRDTIRYRSSKEDCQRIQSPGAQVARTDEHFRQREKGRTGDRYPKLNNSYPSMNEFQSPRHLDLNENSDLLEIHAGNDKFGDKLNRISPRQRTYDNESTVEKFESPSSNRRRLGYVNGDFFSPSGHMAKLHLNTQRSKLIDNSGDFVSPRQSTGHIGREQRCTDLEQNDYDNVGEFERYPYRRGFNQIQRQHSDEPQRGEIYVESLSDKENEFVDRTGFISLDRISPASGPVNVHMKYNGSDRRESSAMSGRGSNERCGNSGGHRRTVSNLDRHSPTERKQKSPKTSKLIFTQAGLQTAARNERVMQSPSSKNNSYSFESFRDDTPEELERNGRMVNTEGKSKQEKLVSAKQAVSRDYNVAQVRKMDVGKQFHVKPRMKKSLFTGTRNVATPVSFNDFAEGISGSEVCELADGKISKQLPVRQTEFKMPFNVNIQQNSGEKKTGKRSPYSKKPFQPQASYKDIMSSTAVDNSRLTSGMFRPGGASFVHSTPMGGRMPVLLNETISTIQAPEDNEDEVVLI